MTATRLQRHGHRATGTPLCRTQLNVEAHERGLGSELAAFVALPDLLLRRLTASDMTTSPAGYPIQASDRIEEILRRYPQHDPVHEAIRLSGTSLIDIANAEDARVRIGQSQSPLTATGNGA